MRENDFFLSQNCVFLSRNNPVRSEDRKELEEYPNIFFSRKWNNGAGGRRTPYHRLKREGGYIPPLQQDSGSI